MDGLKKQVLMLSTSLPMRRDGSKETCSRRGNEIQLQVSTTVVRTEFTTNMRGVNVANQLHSTYSCIFLVGCNSTEYMDNSVLMSTTCQDCINGAP